MIRREQIIKNANSEQLLELIEKCKGKGKVALPVVIVVMGFLTKKSDKLLKQIAETENMKIVDHTEIEVRMNYAEPTLIENEWKRQINEAMVNYKGVIILRHFGDNMMTRENMIVAARTGMKTARVILLKLGTDPVKGFAYHQEKYHERFSNESQMVIAQNIMYKEVGPNERFNYIVEMAK